jgi:hypothetical protein
VGALLKPGSLNSCHIIHMALLVLICTLVHEGLTTQPVGDKGHIARTIGLALRLEAFTHLLATTVIVWLYDTQERYMALTVYYISTQHSLRVRRHFATLVVLYLMYFT